MKNIVKILLLALISFSVSACYEELKKDDFNATMDNSKVAVVTTGDVIKNLGESLVVNISVVPASSDPILQQGVLISETQQIDLNTASVFTADEANQNNVSIDGLTSGTTYYYIAFAYNINGIAYGEVKSVRAATQEVLDLVDNSNFLSRYQQFNSIDKDGDGETWLPSYIDANNTQLAFLSFSYDNSTYTALRPENYLLFPAVTIPANSIAPKLVVTLQPLDPTYYKEVYKIVISQSAITSSNCQSAEVLVKKTMIATVVNETIDIPDSYIGKTVYIALCHFDCEDWFALAYRGHRVSVIR